MAGERDKPPLSVVLLHYGADDVPDWGFNRSMRCPFHDDTHESASLNVETDLFRCFTCGIQGDVYAVIQQVDGVDFLEAKRRAEAIAKESGIEVRSKRRPGKFIPSGPWSQRSNRKRSRSGGSRRSRTWA